MKGVIDNLLNSSEEGYEGNAAAHPGQCEEPWQLFEVAGTQEYISS